MSKGEIRAREIGRELSEIRKRRGISVKDLQKRSKLSTASIYRVFAGKCTLVSCCAVAESMQVRLKNIEITL